MQISISKKAIVWSYLAQFFMIGTGLITLPVVLKTLSPQEVGLNYIFLSVNSIIALLDMGFSSQFARNITYLFSGAQNLQREGFDLHYSNVINERLLVTTLKTAKKLYKILSFIGLTLLLTLGTLYISHVTDGFKTVNNSLAIWLIFCVSCFFNIYYLYLSAFLQGRGLVEVSQKGQVFSKITQIVITLSLLFSGSGLIGVVISTLLSPFVFRYYSYHKFYDSYIKAIVKKFEIDKKDQKEVFFILLYNAKKMGIIGVLATAIGYASTIIIGIFLPLTDVASYGLMVQLVGIIITVSRTYSYSLSPQFANLMVQQKHEELANKFGLSIGVFICIQIVGLIGMISLPTFIRLLEFKTTLPSLYIVVLFYIYKFFEQNQSLYCQLMIIENNLVFYKSAVITGFSTVFSLFLFLRMGYGLLGVVIAQSLPLYVYVGWKWPIYVTNRYNIPFNSYVVQNTFKQIKKLH